MSKILTAQYAKNIRNILIAPENPGWKINLTVDTLSVASAKIY